MVDVEEKFLVNRSGLDALIAKSGGSSKVWKILPLNLVEESCRIASIEAPVKATNKNGNPVVSSSTGNQRWNVPIFLSSGEKHEVAGWMTEGKIPLSANVYYASAVLDWPTRAENPSIKKGDLSIRVELSENAPQVQQPQEQQVPVSQQVPQTQTTPVQQ